MHTILKIENKVVASIIDNCQGIWNQKEIIKHKTKYE